MQDTLFEGTDRTRNAAGTCSGHRQRTRRICAQKCGWASLSDDERLVEELRVSHKCGVYARPACAETEIINNMN